jgi:hypothetical protein
MTKPDRPEINYTNTEDGRKDLPTFYPFSFIKTLILFTITFGLTVRGAAQNLVKDYKRVADKSLLFYFDTIIVSKIQCDRFMAVSLDKRGSSRYFYNENKNKKLSFSIITFTYSLFDKVLNDDIEFYVSVDKKFKIIRDSSILKKVPTCIRIIQPCNFISSDNAKQIAITDSIMYADNLSCQLEINKFDKDYYWIITGHKPSKKSTTNKSSIRLYAETISMDQRRIIHAQTGQIISSKKFDYNWN